MILIKLEDLEVIPSEEIRENWIKKYEKMMAKIEINEIYRKFICFTALEYNLHPYSYFMLGYISLMVFVGFRTFLT